MVEDFITIKEAAQLKRVSKSAIYAAIRQGRLSAENILGRKAVKRTEVLAWQPIAYAGRPGVKSKGGRPTGIPMDPEAKARISESQKRRWAELAEEKKLK